MREEDLPAARAGRACIQRNAVTAAAVWGLRALLLTAALVRPSLVSTVYMALALLSFLGMPLVTSPFRLVGACPTALQAWLAGVALVVSLTASVCHVLQRAASVIPSPASGGVQSQEEDVWLRMFGFDGEGAFGSLEGTQRVAPDAVVLSLTLAGFAAWCALRCTHDSESEDRRKASGARLPLNDDPAASARPAGARHGDEDGRVSVRPSRPSDATGSRSGSPVAGRYATHSEADQSARAMALREAGFGPTMGLSALTAALALACTAILVQSAVSLPLLVILVVRATRWACSSAAWWGRPTLLGSRLLAIVIAVYCGLAAVAWHGSSAILTMLRPEALAPVEPPAWFFELEKLSAAVGLLRLPAGGGTSWYTAHFVSLIVATAAFAALFQRKVAVSRAQAARRAEEEEGEFAAAGDGTSGGASRGASAGSLAGAPPKAASDEAVAVGAFGAAGLSAAWGRGHAAAAGGGTAHPRAGRAAGRVASRAGRAAAGARSTRISVRVRTRRVPRPILDCCGAVCEAALPDHLAGRATGAWGAKALRRARREELRSGPMLPDEEGHVCATVCGCVCTPCPANRPGPSCASRVLASLVSLMRGQLGMTLVLAAILAWITTFPDAVSLAYAVAVVGVFVLARGSNGTTAASPLIASSVRAFAAVHSLYLLGFHASCAVAPFFAPAPFIAASRSDDADVPLNTQAVFHLYNGLALLLGIVPGQYTPLRMAFGLGVLVFAAVYSKAASVPPDAALVEAEVALAHSVAGTVEAALSDVVGQYAWERGPHLDDETTRLAHWHLALPPSEGSGGRRDGLVVSRAPGTGGALVGGGSVSLDQVGTFALEKNEWRGMSSGQTVRLPCVMAFAVQARWGAWALLQWLRSQSHWLALVAMYVLGLSHVDVVAAGYLVFFVLFFVSKRARSCGWRLLVAYSGVSVCVVVGWWVMALHDRATALAIPGWAFGLSPPPHSPPMSGSSAPSLWFSVTVPTNVLIFLLVSSQLSADFVEDGLCGCTCGGCACRRRAAEPRTRRQTSDDAIAAARNAAEVRRRFPWAEQAAAWLVGVWLRNGVWLCFGLYLVLPLLRPTVMGLVTLVVLSVVLGFYLVSMQRDIAASVAALELRGSGTDAKSLGRGAAAAAQATQGISATRLRVPLGAMSAIQAVFLLLRYVYQFGSAQRWIDQLWNSTWLADWFTVHQLGLERYTDDSGNALNGTSLYLSLLDTVALFLVAMLLIGAISATASSAAATAAAAAAVLVKLARARAEAAAMGETLPDLAPRAQPQGHSPPKAPEHASSGCCVLRYGRSFVGTEHTVVADFVPPRAPGANPELNVRADFVVHRHGLASAPRQRRRTVVPGAGQTPRHSCAFDLCALVESTLFHHGGKFTVASLGVAAAVQASLPGLVLLVTGLVLVLVLGGRQNASVADGTHHGLCDSLCGTTMAARRRGAASEAAEAGGDYVEAEDADHDDEDGVGGTPARAASSRKPRNCCCNAVLCVLRNTFCCCCICLGVTEDAAAAPLRGGMETESSTDSDDAVEPPPWGTGHPLGLAGGLNSDRDVTAQGDPAAGFGSQQRQAALDQAVHAERRASALAFLRPGGAVQDHRWRGAGALDDGVQLAEAEASNRLAARSLGVLGRIGRAAPSDAPLSHAGPQGGFFSSARAAVTGGRGSRAGNYAAVPSSSSSSSEKASSGSSRAESAAGAPRVAAPAADAEAAAEQSRIASVPLPLPSMCGMEPDLPYRPIAVDNAWGAAQASIRTSDVLVALGPTGLGALESAGSSLGGGSSRGLTAAASVTALRNAQQTRTAASINWEARVTEHRTASLADLLPSAPLSVLSVFRAGFTHTAARLAVHRLRRVRAAMRRRPKGSTPMPEQFYGTSVRARELPRRPFRDAWLIVLPIAGLLLLAKYASQFKFAASLDASLTGLDGRWAGFWVVNTANNATMPLSGRPDWAPLGVPSSIPGSGVAPSGFVYSTIFAGMWALVGPEVFVIVMAVLQRWAHTLDSQDTLRERRRLGKLHSTGVLEAIAADAGSLDARVPLDQATVRALGVMQAVGLRVMLMAGLRRAPSDGAMAEVSPVAVAGEQPGATASAASAAGATAAAAPAGRVLSDADAAAAWPGSRGSGRPPPVRTRLGLDAAAAPAPDRRPRLASGGAGVEPADLLPLQWEVHRAVPVGVLLDGPAADAAARHALFLAGGGYTSMLDSGKLHVWDGDGAGGHITLTRGSALQSGSVATVAALAFGGAALEAAHAAVRYAEAGTPFRLAVYAAACDLAVRHGLEPPEPPAMAWVSPEQVAAVRLCLAVEAPGAPRSVALKLARLRLRSRQGSATSLGSDGGSEELGFLRQTMEERGSPSRSRVVSAGAEAPAAGHGVADGARVAVSSLRRSASAASTDSPARAAASAAGGAAAPTPPIGERRPRAPTRVEERANLVALESRSRFETAAARLRVVRERLLRPLVPASAACGRSLERHRGRTLLAISAVLLVAASLCLLSFWSLPLVFYAAVAIWTAVMRPTAADALADASPALRDAALVEADSPGGVAALLIAAQANNGCRGPALLLVRWLLALQILAQYVLILGVPPALWSQQGSDGRALPLTIWPWSADQAARAWLGMPEQGRDAVWLLTLQMLAFLGIALAVRYDRSRQRAAVLLLAGRHFVNVLQSDVDKASAASALGGHPAAPRHRASSKADARPKTEEELHAAQDKLAKLSASIAAAVVRSHRLKAKARLWRVRRYASVVSEAMDMAERGSDMAIPLQTAAAPFGGRRAAMGDKEAATSRRAAAGNEVMNELEGARVFGSNIDGFVAVVATYSGSVIAAILLTIAMLDGSQDIQTFFLVALLLYVLFRRERQPGSGQNQAAVADSQVMGKHAQMSLSNLIAGLPSLGQVLSLPGSDKGAKSGAESVASGASPGAAASVRSAEEVSARGNAASDQGSAAGAADDGAVGDPAPATPSAKPAGCCKQCCGCDSGWGKRLAETDGAYHPDHGDEVEGPPIPTCSRCLGWHTSSDRAAISARIPWIVMLVASGTFLLMQLVYQIPSVDGIPACAAQATCLTAEGLIGLRKLSLPGFAVDEASPCFSPLPDDSPAVAPLSNSTQEPSNVNCPSPFQMSGGGLGLLLLMVIGSLWQLLLLDSSVTNAVRAAHAEDAVRARLRGWVWFQHERHRRQKQTRAFKTQLRTRRRRLRALVRRVARWRALLDGAKTAASTVAAASNAFPPAAPRLIRAAVLPTGDVEVSWDPPVGYTNETPRGQQSALARSSSTGQADEMDSDEDSNGRRSSVRRSHEGVAGAGSVSSSTFLAGSGTMMAIGALQPAADLTYDVSWQARGSQLFPATITPRTAAGQHSVVLRGLPIGRHVTLTVRACNPAGAGPFADKGAEVGRRTWVAVLGSGPVELAKAARVSAGNRGLDVEAAAWRAGAAPLLGAQTVAAILASQALREAAGAKADADAASQTLTSPQADAPGPAGPVQSPPARGPPQPLAAASAGRPSLAPPPQHQHHSSGSGASSAGSPPAGGIVLHDRQAGSVPAAVAAQAAQAPVQGAEVGGVPIVLTGGATLTPKEQADLRLRAAAAAKTARGEDDQGCVAATRTWFAGLCAPGPEKDAAELLRGADDTAFGWFVNKLAGAVDRTVKPRPVAGFVSSLVTLEDAFVAVGLRCRGAASGGDGNDDDDDDSGRSGRDRQGCCACCAKPGPNDASAGPQTGESIVESASKVDGQDAATVMSASVRGAGQAGDARSEAGGKPAPSKRAAASRGAADEDEDEDEDDTGGDGKPSKGEAAAAAGMEDVDEAAAEVEEENTGRVSHTLRSLLRERAELAVSDAKAGAVTAGEAWALLPWWARVGLLAHLSMFAVLSHTHVLVAAVAVLSLLVDASVVAALPTVVLLVLILPRYPMAPAASWWALTIWLVVLVVVKNLLQTPLFCLLVHPETRNLFWAAGAECVSPSPITPATSSSLAPGTVLYPASSPQAIVAAAQLVQPVQAFGITKFSPLLGGEGFGPGIAWDCILLLTLLVHRAALVAKGTWATDGVVGISAVRSAAAAEAAILPAPKATKDRDAMAFGQESDEEEDKADPEGEDDEQAPEAVVVAAAAFSRKRRSSAGSGRMAAAASAVSAAHAAAAAAPGRPRGASALRRTALDAIAEGQEGPSAALSAARGDVDPAADGVDVDELAGHHGGNGDSPHSGGHSPSGDKHDSDDDDDGLIQGLADVAAHSGNLGHSRSRSSPDHDEGALLAAIVGIAPAASAPGQAAGGAPLSEGGAAQAPIPPPPALSGAAAAGAQRRHSRGESDPDDTDTYDEDVDEAGSDGLGAGAADSGPASAAQPAWATVMEAVLPFEAAPSPAPLGRSRRRSGSDVAGAALTPEERLDAEAEVCAGKGLPTALQSDFAVVRWAAFTVAREEILPKWRRRLEGELAIAAAGTPSPAGDAADRASLARQQLHRDGPDPRQAAEPQDSGAGVASSGQPYRRHTSGARVPFQREGIAGLPPHTESAPSQLRDAPPDASADGKAAALEQVVVHTGAATEGAPAPAPAGKTDSGTPLSGGRPSPRANVAVAAATAVVMAPVRASDRLLSCARMCAAKSVLCAFDTLSGITNRQYQGLSRRMPDKPGVDLFWGTAIAQLVLLLYTLVTFGAMTGNGAGLQEELAYNQFSGSLVVALVLQIFLMAVDRVAFLWRSATLKAVLQAVTSIGVHISVFYVIPLQTQRRFGGENKLLVVYYILWLVVLVMGAMQLHYGFARTPPRDTLKAGGPDSLRYTLLLIANSIPFLLELRGLLDWAATKTSLDVFMWMKLESIHNALYVTQNDMNYRKADKETLSGKQQQPFWAAKFIYGWCMVIVILVCIVGPMLLFSNLNPTLESNLITNVATTVRLMGENRSYAVYASTQTESIELASTIGGNDKWFLQLQSNASGAEDAPVGAGALLAVRSPVETDWLDQTQRSVVFPFPDRRWTVAPPALDSLVDLLGRAAGSELRAFERRLAPSRGLAAPAQSSSEAAPQAQPAPRATTGFASRLFPEAALRPYAAEYSPRSSAGRVRLPHFAPRSLQLPLPSPEPTPGPAPAPPGAPPIVSLSLEGQFERPGPTGAEVARWESAVPISQEQALVLHDALVAAANSSFAARTTTAVGAPIVVRGVFPYVLRLPATTAVAAIGQRTRDIRLQLHIGIPADPLEAQAMRRRAEAEAEAFAASRGFGARGDGLAARATSTMQVDPATGEVRAALAVPALPATIYPLWWTAEIPADDKFGPAPEGGGLEFITVSDRIAPNLLTSSLGGSIIAVYTLLLITVAGLFRGTCVVKSQQVMYQELEDCRYLMELCEAIHFAEADTQYPRHLENEVYLYETLIGFYRSPEILARITRKRD
ncbi:hypothetical protein FNF27_06913 [Cafeteria roenbergensis]|uniref:Piezo non-specific cation channel R-Ras-binding domain-containing protein n=3 Tax=Cafeteria roenbergensis TaxID=33653 RepID=A0A5A8DWL3_CAFRO|nr:hypothetical protein FNF27_06913 [Cafeteria roenbergensis]